MITKEFEEAYKRLNKAQKEAVDTIEGPVMVIAGPGTGKTQILTLRIANILKETDTPPSGILALTFTEAGQKAMKMRLRSLIGSRADEVNISTYHGFAKTIIDEYSDHFPHLARAQQLSEVEEESLLRNILCQKKFAKLRPLGEPDLYLNEIVRSISNCRKEAWTPDIVRQDAEREIERLKNDPASISSRGATKGKIKAVVEKQIEKLEKTILFAQVYEEYEEKKRADRKTDFDDLIFELIEALDRDDLLLRLLQEKYLYILVDEHQDTNNSQNLLIRKLADFYEEPNLFVVGDEKQAVYRFQGASVNNFLEFQKIWPTMKIVSLTDNYRSGQNILDASFGMIENNYEAGEHTNLRIRLSSAGEVESEPVVVVTAGNNEAGEEYLVKEIKNIIADE
ncbi:MAG TPA: UvrD-helicase domain-containing protein, partial [Candidatus Paceibacterota bacterium]|nr:UvrD-helicase domain-containing protein [Candidatus Paceibacterota bacterium]